MTKLIVWKGSQANQTDNESAMCSCQEGKKSQDDPHSFFGTRLVTLPRLLSKLHGREKEELNKYILGFSLSKRIAEEEELNEAQNAKKSSTENIYDELLEESGDMEAISAEEFNLKRFGEELQTKTSKRLKSDEEKDDESTKKTGKRRKQIARIHTDHDKDDSEDSDEASEKDDSTSGTKVPINPIPVAIKSPSIANYKIIKQGRKGVYQIVRENGTDMVYISFGAMLTDISRDDLTELYKIVMRKHGINEPEDEFEKVLWEYLKNIVHCLNLETVDIYMLIERKYPLSAEVCKAMLDKKLQRGKLDEDCYKLLKMMEKQAGIRKTTLGKDFSNPFMADNLPKIIRLSTHHIWMDDPNMTMEEYIKFEEEKARRRGWVFNWKTATYGKIRVNDDLHDLISVEAEFPTIVINDAFALQDAPQCKSQASSPSSSKSYDMALPPREQRHRFLRYEGLEYTDTDIEDFKARLARSYRMEVHRVQVFDFGGLPDLMAEGLSARILMEHRDDQGTIGFGAYWADSAGQIPDKGDLSDYWIGIFSTRDFLGTAPSYTIVWDPILRLCHRLISCSITGRSQAPEKVTVTDLFYLRGMDVSSVNVPYLLARYLRLFAAGRKTDAYISGGKFVARLAEHFGLMTAEILRGLTVAMGLERKPDAAESAPAVAEDDPVVNEGDQAVLAPVQAPQQPPPPPPAAARTVSQRLGRLEEEVQGLRRDLMDASGLTYQAFDGTFRGSSPAAFLRCTRQRTGKANTSAT
ncbi:hypothetical protein Tco_1264394 [Tanacetum coccineum]